MLTPLSLTRRTIPFAFRGLHGHKSVPTAPPARGNIQSPSDFLQAIGRNLQTKVTLQNWEELWRLEGEKLKKSGVGVKDRRYLLWAMEKYRQGQEPATFAHPETPKKKFRGWGPRVQHGKRVR